MQALCKVRGALFSWVFSGKWHFPTIITKWPKFFLPWQCCVSQFKVGIFYSQIKNKIVFIKLYTFKLRWVIGLIRKLYILSKNRLLCTNICNILVIAPYLGNIFITSCLDFYKNFSICSSSDSCTYSSWILGFVYASAEFLFILIYFLCLNAYESKCMWLDFFGHFCLSNLIVHNITPLCPEFIPWLPFYLLSLCMVHVHGV